MTYRPCLTMFDYITDSSGECDSSDEGGTTVQLICRPQSLMLQVLLEVLKLSCVITKLER